MMEKMIALQQKRRSRKGGFTLVELIVVLVILAILAALLIPALTGYIDKAKQKSAIAETRQCVMAAQTLLDETYGSTGTSTAPAINAVVKLAEVSGTIAENSITVNGNTISGLKYTAKNHQEITYSWDKDTGASYTPKDN